MRIESRKGILSRKSSVNKNSFYKQKSKDTLPNKLYGVGSAGYSSYFNKNGPIGSASGNFNLPQLNSYSPGGVGQGTGQGPSP